ncbi:MAG TPA: LPS assembly protein LptD [Thermoanaerobaculia bacterium]|nr:LPS assembly protein LptD [Thermoanaerobaculia bacterium]
MSRRHLLALALLALSPAAFAQEPAADKPAAAPVVEPGTTNSPPGVPTTTPEAPATPPATAPTTPATPGAPPATATNPATPPAAPAVPPGPPGAGPDRIDFDLHFQTDKGGAGSAAGSAASLEYQREDYAVLAGEVRLRYQDLDLQADTAEVDLKTKQVIAFGHVVLDQGSRRLAGDSLKFDLGAKTGTMAHASASVSPDYYFTGDEIAKVGPDLYTVKQGVFTSCTQKVPDWSFRLSQGTVEVDGYAHVRNASMRAKRLPIFYTPYLVWPVKSERTSGLLIPNIGYSQNRGSLLGLAYFQTLGRSFDTTFHVDPYSKGFLGLGDELRYRPSEGTIGNAIGYAIRDPDERKWRWKLEWNHEMNALPFGLRAVVRYQDFSDFNFFRDFERDFDRSSFRFQDSRAFVTGNWGASSLNVLLNDRKTFVDFNNFVTQRKLPEIDYQLRSTRLGKLPLYLQIESSADYLDLDRPQSTSGRYGRADLFPQLTLPIHAFPWLSFSVTGGERLTWYGDTVSTDPTKMQAFTGESELRRLPSASALLVGPSFSRIWNAQIGSFTKFKHLIEPRFTYTYFGAFDDTAKIPLFDEIDNSFSQNVGRAALINRLLGKSDDPTGSGAREILYLELAQNFSFDPKQPLQFAPDPKDNKTEGPLEALLRLNPTKGFNAKMEVSYNTLFKRIQSRSFSGGLDWKGNNSVDLTWFTNYIAQSGDTVGDQIRVTTSLNVIPRRLRLDAQLSYSLKDSELQSQRYVATWTSQCWGVHLEVRDAKAGTFTNRDYRLSIDLKNVGTFLDLTGRTSGNPQDQ